MKKTLFSLIILLLFSCSTFAQRGSVLLYGNVNYSSSKSTYPTTAKSSSFSITPGIGLGINDHFTAGLNLGYGIYGGVVTSHSYAAGPFVRYTQAFTPIFAFFVQMEGKYEYDNLKTSPDRRTYKANLFPAIEASLKNGFALNFNLGGVSFLSQKNKGWTGSTNLFVIDLGSGAGFGVSKRFGGTKK